MAIASRDAAKAKDMAARFGIAKSYGSYEDLLADPEIDAIYNPLPNHLHVPMTIKALEQGKAVLCEKPIALDAVQVRERPPHKRQRVCRSLKPSWFATIRNGRKHVC
ncbi:putative dehydrogenase [Agrobacterium tumefaciens]|nr:putative dehydrogenase [Agrobacterium radiobacter]MBB5589157.1 putative dehydrogenase [Agrobacterium radiobacter]